MNVALDKTIHEFKMWGSMSRKPGQPADRRLKPPPAPAWSRLRRKLLIGKR